MKILKTVSELKEWSSRKSDLGFVPTMGALHKGHLSLVQNSKQYCGSTLVSIFVNPTQFNNPNDLQTYPHTLEQDLQLLSNENVDAVFLPDAKELYADDYTYKVTELKNSLPLEGAHRPGHFDGVLSVMTKLLIMTGCQKCFMGEKDYQQLMLIQGLVQSLFIPTQIVSVPTVRETDGLALSSRNRNLTPDAREKAPLIYKLLMSDQPAQTSIQQLESAGFRVEYFEKRWGRKLAAVEIDGVRLIDNV